MAAVAILDFCTNTNISAGVQPDITVNKSSKH